MESTQVPLYAQIMEVTRSADLELAAGGDAREEVKPRGGGEEKGSREQRKRSQVGRKGKGSQAVTSGPKAPDSVPPAEPGPGDWRARENQ